MLLQVQAISCDRQFVEFVSDLTDNMYVCHRTDVLVMDFRKALGKVATGVSAPKYRIMVSQERWATGLRTGWGPGGCFWRGAVKPHPNPSTIQSLTALNRVSLYIHFLHQWYASEPAVPYSAVSYNTLIYLAIDSQRYAMVLQHDLDLLSERQ